QPFGDGVPGVDLENPDLHEADQPWQILNDEIFADLLLLPDGDATQGRWGPHADVLLVEALLGQPLGAAYQRRGSSAQVRQDPVGDRLVEPRQVELGNSLARVQDAIGMRESDPGHLDRVRPGGLARAARSSWHKGALRARSRHGLRPGRPLAHDLASGLVL